VTIEIWPVEGLPEIREGDDLAAMLGEPLRALGARDDDIVAITQKIVSKAEGRVVPDEGAGRSVWIERETRRIVAQRGELIIAETRHGFVCANAGVDASNVEDGYVSLLPVDPDTSSEAIRASLVGRLGLSRLGVVMTDTFGRPWRNGLVNVAIGCAGLPAILDLRGQTDHHGRELEVTVVALADEVAAASGLVMGKSARVPVALVRGVDIGAAAPGRAAELVRSPDEDLFREGTIEP
jgi:coenzyme F420-0:L-glutamate ligase/coenzyme F420-1:gamma-L-glutamate ligase